MINNQLINPRNIVVVGGSNDLSKPGGKILKNIIDGEFKGELMVVNPKSDQVQGVKSYRHLSTIPDVDLAIIAIAAKYCLESVEILTRDKNCKAFIIISASFGEESEEGSKLEKRIVKVINAAGACLIGPNCIGVINQSFNGVFTEPIPRLDPFGVDFISGSGAIAVYIMETAIPNGITFSSVYSVGNSAQMGVEDIVKHLDETFDPKKSSKTKLLYLESVNKPGMLLKHTSSLIRKGCKIAAIKAGTTEAGSRAASSHTGALANSDSAVEALFNKAGIIRCISRHELSATAGVLLNPLPRGKNLAIITHAGGPAVMMTDTLSEGGMVVPHLSGERADALLEKLFPGSSVSNPIDILATGNAEQLGEILESCENDFDEIDAVAVIFGSPGLFSMDDVYSVLDQKMEKASKPVYPILPSLMTAKREVEEFIARGRINFPDEVVFANAFCKVLNNKHFSDPVTKPTDAFRKRIREIIDNNKSGFLPPEGVQKILDASGISRVNESVSRSVDEVVAEAEKLGYPLVMKVVGPIHKSDVGGVKLGINNQDEVRAEFNRMMGIKNTEAVMLQPMTGGVELFVGAKDEKNFGHLVMAGLGGIFIEVLKDVRGGLVPIGPDEALNMISSLKGYELLEGVRGQKGVNIEAFINVIIKISLLLEAAPEIIELDLNPLMGSPENVITVDARICIEKK